ncbi:MAG: type IV secretion system DNA-binding domain-containing protein, partial [Verrucomicrobiaceae bacterium]
MNRPELVKQATEKFSNPLFAVVLRFAASADDADRAWRIIAEMAGGFSSLAKANGNNFVPLANTDYDFQDHEEDLLRRQSRRAGMLLNLDELVSLVHFPDASIHAPKLRQDTGRTRAMPSAVCDGSITLGENIHAGIAQPVTLSVEQRVRHVHVMGASGTGKSTLLFNLIRQDIENGEGVAVLDPHGDLIEQVLGIIPQERIDDVVLVDPSDEEYSIGFNMLSAHSDFEKTLLASDLVSVFQRLSTSWGDQMASVLNNAILAFLESSEGGTLADLRRFLLDAAWRKNFLRTVNDPDIVFYWEKGFPQLGGNKSIGPVLTRLESFLAPKPIRFMVSQRENKIDFADITDSGKIFLAKLSQGQMGRENAWLLGSLLVSKLQQTAMARQRMRAEQRRPFWLYIDEFHHFITPSMAEILSGARKYRLGLTLAHQDLAQLKRDPEVASSVLSNAGTRIVFRISDGDARAMEEGFAHFTARELQSLEIGEAICRMERADADFNLHVQYSESMDESEAAPRRETVMARSREQYATPRSQIEEKLRRGQEPSQVVEQPAEKKAERSVVEPPPAKVSDEIMSELAAIKEQLQKIPHPAPVEQAEPTPPKTP